MSSEITTPQKNMTPEGLVGQILELESQATAKAAEAREIQKMADILREQVMLSLNTIGIKSVRH